MFIQNQHSPRSCPIDPLTILGKMIKIAKKDEGGSHGSDSNRSKKKVWKIL
jgi:hypothetical protein